MADLDHNGHELRAGLRYPWVQAPESGQVREVAPGVWWLRMPLPFRLDHINLYLPVSYTHLTLPTNREV